MNTRMHSDALGRNKVFVPLFLVSVGYIREKFPVSLGRKGRGSDNVLFRER